MTAPSYTEDLTDFTNGTGDEGSGWSESSNTSWDDQGPPAYQDADYPYIQGSYAVTADCTKTGIGTLFANNGSTFTIPTDGALLVWQNFSSPLALETFANGGLRVMIGSGLGVFWSWDVGGKDFGKYPYGGWQNHAVNDTVGPSDIVGSYSGGSHQYAGAGVNVVTGIGKGEVHQVDILRYGRCSAIFEYGDLSNGYCTFAGFAAQNDNTSNRWGLIQAIPGGYLWKGRMSLGTASNAVDFRDSGVLVLLDSTPKVTANFNTIEVLNASSNIDWSNITIINVDPTNTASRGRWITTNDATVDLVGCSFTDMGTFTFDSNTTLTSCIFSRCDEVTTGGATIDKCTFDESNDSVTAVSVATPAEAVSITNCQFNSDGTGHAIEIGGTAANITLTGNVFSGYDTANPGTAANKAIFVNISTGSMTINISGGSGVSQDYHVRSAGCTVTVSADTTVTFRNLRANTEVRVYKVSDDSVVDGIENATTVDPDYTGRYTWSFATASTTEVYYQIINKDYEILRNESYTVPASDSDIVIFQRADRNYSNP